MVKKSSRILGAILSLAFVLSMVYAPAFAATAAADTEIPDYIQRATIDGVEYLLFDSGEDMVWLRNHVLNMEDGGTTDAWYCTHNIMLTADIDMTGYNGLDSVNGTYYTEGYNNGQYSGIGFAQKWCGFSGIFDGNGHTISNIDVYNNQTVGTKGLLFNLVKDATIKNVALQGTVDSNRFIGGVVGRALGSLTLENVVVNADLTLNGGNANAVGGLVGQLGSGRTTGGSTISIENCAALGTFTSNTSGNPVGGLIGYIYGGFDVDIVNSYAAASLSSVEDTAIAGLIGGQGTETLKVENCYYLDSMGPSLLPMAANSDAGQVGPDDPNVDAKSVTEEYMKSSSFLTALRGAFQTDPRTGYPIPAAIGASDAAFLWDGMPVLTYSVGEYFDLTGLTITNSDGVDITSYAQAGRTDALTAEDDGATVTVTVTYGGITESKEYTISVRNVRELVVLTGPDKAEYYEGEKFDPAGMVIGAMFGDSTEAAAVTGYTYAPTGALTTDDTAVTVSYYGKTVTVGITVQESTLDRVEVTPPKNLIYAADEELDLLSFNIYAYYKHAPDTAVKLLSGDGYTVDVNKETGIVAVSYLGKTDSFRACFLKSNAPAIVNGECQIGNADQLVWFSNQVNVCGKFYDAVLLNNADLTGNEWFHPIGTSNAAYTGSFDGGGHTVTLQLNEALVDMGFFGKTENAEIRNVTVAGSIINTSTVLGATGGVVGYAYETVIDNCANEADIRAQSAGNASLSGLGGIVGRLYCRNDYVGTIVNCVNRGSITSVTTEPGGGGVGGIVGNASKATLYNSALVKIENCRNEGAISGANYIGGIAGISSASIRDCHNSGTITAAGGTTNHGVPTSFCAGGIVGEIKSLQSYPESALKQIEIVQVSNTGDVLGGGYVGGIVGYVENGGMFRSESYNRLSIQNAYNTGNITATGTSGYCGGIVGYNVSGGNSFYNEVTGLSVEIKNVYNSGDVTGPNYVGGIIGQDGNFGLYASGTHTLQNVYNVGTVTATSDSSTAGGIVGCYAKGSDAELNMNVSNAYYLEDASGLAGYTAVNVSVAAENVGARTADEMKTMWLVLGEAFVNDGDNINGGYPILAWQAAEESAAPCGVSIGGRGVLTAQLEALMTDVGETAKLCGETPVTARFLPLSTLFADASAACHFRLESTGGTTDAGYGSVSILANELDNLFLYFNADGVLCSAWDGHADGWLTDIRAVICVEDHVWDDSGWCTVCGKQFNSKTAPGQDEDGFYLIGTAEELTWFASYVNEVTVTAKARLTADITVPDSWTSIGNIGAVTYQGVFDGGGHTVTLHGASLFGYADAEIRNVTVAGSVTKACDYAGALVNYLSGGSVDNCHSAAAVTSTGYTGGLIGYVEGSGITISNSSNSGVVSLVGGTGEYVGGLVAYAYEADIIISNSGNSGTVSTESWKAASSSGGLIGIAWAGSVTLTDCYNSGDVSGCQGYTGGLIGRTWGGNTVLTGCCNSGSVSITGLGGTSQYIGGLIGAESNGGENGGLTVTDCYNSGRVSGIGVAPAAAGEIRSIGGLIGYISEDSAAAFTNCYSSGAVSITNGSESYVGAVMGSGTCYEFNNCYYLDTAYTTGRGIGSTEGDFTAVSVTADELKNLAEQLGGAFACDSRNSNGGYPILAWQVSAPEYAVPVDNQTGLTTPAKITGLTNLPDNGGSVTFTVSCPLACVVAVTTDGGATYTRLEATANGDNGYDFTIDNLTADVKVAVVLKGDLNQDGIINGTDAFQVQRAAAGMRTLTGLQSLALDVNGDGTVNGTDAFQIQRFAAGMRTFSW